MENTDKILLKIAQNLELIAEQLQVLNDHNLVKHWEEAPISAMPLSADLRESIQKHIYKYSG